MAAPKKRIKAKDHEKLSDANVAHVIELLRKDKPITKKEACAILNISYNTPRLTTIIENFESRKETSKLRREENRGKPITEDEISSIVSMYLEGNPISDISKFIYRSATLIKSVIEKLGVPQKAIGDDKYLVAVLPDECVSDNFKVDQIVWSAKFHSPCQIIRELKNPDYDTKYGCKVYSIYVLQHLDDVPEFYPQIKVGGFHSASPSYNLGSLEHLDKFDIRYSS